jgi:hypothetical protein
MGSCVCRLCGVGFFRVLFLTMISDILGSAYLAFLFQCNHVVRDAAFPVVDDKHAVDLDWGKMQIATTQDYGHDSYMTYWMTGALNYQGPCEVAERCDASQRGAQ